LTRRDNEQVLKLFDCYHVLIVFHQKSTFRPYNLFFYLYTKKNLSVSMFHILLESSSKMIQVFHSKKNQNG
jgi:hypothetical protein